MGNVGNFASGWKKPYRINKPLLNAAPVLMACWLLTTPAYAISLSDVFGKQTSASASDSKKPLPVDQAFNVVPTSNGNKLTIQINVTDGYYTYKDKLKLELPAGVTATPLTFNQTATYVDDPDFGRVPVFDKTVTATTTLHTTRPITNASAVIKWQGCAKAGLCYPPEKVTVNITQLAPVATPSHTSSSNAPASAPNPRQANTASLASTALATTATQPVASAAVVAVPTASDTRPINNTDTIADQDIFGLTTHTGLALCLLFLAGLGLAFTPCVLPMLPIVANIVARQHNPSAKKGLMLTGGYGLGVATSYGLIGALVAVFGQSLGLMAMLQNPVILLSFAALFILLGLYMLDKLPLRLPARFSQRLQGLTQVGESRLGSVTGSFITGFFSALVVSPCVSAPLAGALAGVAMTGNALLGFAALFLLGLGLSTPLILLGMTQGNFMPKAGAWMNWVKTGFALMMFAVALLLIERVLLSSLMLALWALWFAVVAVWLWRWAGQGRLLSRALALLMGIWTACLMVGVAIGSQDSWQPLTPLLDKQPLANRQQPTPSAYTRITKLEELTPILQRYPNVVVDVTADWCIECRINDKNLFANPPAALSNWHVVKLDVTDNTPDAKTVYQTLKVFGPPVFLYYRQGKLVARQHGEIKRQDFERQLVID